MITDKIYFPTILLDYATEGFEDHFKGLWDHPDMVDEASLQRLDAIAGHTSIFKDDALKSIVGIAEIMRLTGKPKEGEVRENYDEEELLPIICRVGTAIEMLGMLASKCNEIHANARRIIERVYQLKNGEIKKDSNGHFESVKLAK